MPLTRAEVQDLYTDRLDQYLSFIHFVRSPQGTRALLENSDWLRSGMRVLDAGCGTGLATFALIDALRRKRLFLHCVDAFDLTLAMLDRFRQTLATRGISGVELRQADVLALETLPSTCTNYDLILSTSMLEYLPETDFPHALEGLAARLAPGGRLFCVITKKTPESRFLIGRWWHAERYTRRELEEAFRSAGFEQPVFRHFPWRYFWLNRGSFAVEAKRE